MSYIKHHKTSIICWRRRNRAQKQNWSWSYTPVLRTMKVKSYFLATPSRQLLQRKQTGHGWSFVVHQCPLFSKEKLYRTNIFLWKWSVVFQTDMVYTYSTTDALNGYCLVTDLKVVLGKALQLKDGRLARLLFLKYLIDFSRPSYTILQGFANRLENAQGSGMFWTNGNYLILRA